MSEDPDRFGHKIIGIYGTHVTNDQSPGESLHDVMGNGVFRGRAIQAKHVVVDASWDTHDRLPRVPLAEAARLYQPNPWLGQGHHSRCTAVEESLHHPKHTGTGRACQP